MEIKNCIFCDYFTKYKGKFICMGTRDGAFRIIDATPKPKWCPLDQPSTESEENHRYQTACECGKLDV